MVTENDLLSRIESLEIRFQEITSLITAPDIIADQKRFMKLSKEYRDLERILDKGKEYRNLLGNIQEGRETLELESDPELRAMAREMMQEAEQRIPSLEEEIKLLLIPADPEDAKNVVMEIRGGAGGDEGNIFAGDLYRMYSKYAESKGWKVQVLEASVSEAGGYTQIIFSVKGTDVYKELKFESGVHRVQRVPKTETQGRIHTSTATVLCQPEAEDTDIEIDPKDLTIETHRASGAGGQHINKTDSAVRIVHVPTGITVNCQDGRSQIENRETAMRLIRARVYEELKRIQEEEAGKIRRAKIGTGDRSEKIRTYNYPQNRVTDHRIGLTITQLDRIMEGKLDGVIEGLLAEEEKRKLEETQL